MATERGGERGPENGVGADGWERRQALQLVAQLPDDTDASLRILGTCKLLVDFLSMTRPVASRVTG